MFYEVSNACCNDLQTVTDISKILFMNISGNNDPFDPIFSFFSPFSSSLIFTSAKLLPIYRQSLAIFLANGY